MNPVLYALYSCVSEVRLRVLQPLPSPLTTYRLHKQKNPFQEKQFPHRQEVPHTLTQRIFLSKFLFLSNGSCLCTIAARIGLGSLIFTLSVTSSRV